jgi:threonine 3-dehydrogenase
LPTLQAKSAAGRVREDQYAHPTTMYGCNKLYCEQLGTYYARHYKQLAAEPASGKVDFRCVRFPGLISALTVPSGGTSDYAPEMIHAAAKGEPYECFVRPDTRIPFMAMPDGVDALMTFAAAPRGQLTRTAYNVAAFNPSAEEVRAVVMDAFPEAQISWDVDRKRQGIVDSWPADVDDSAARRDWGFAPRYDFERAFTEYLIPTIRRQYARRTVHP